MYFNQLLHYNWQSDDCCYLIEISFFDKNDNEYQILLATDIIPENYFVKSFTDNYRKKGSISEITSLYDKIISSYKSKDKTTFNEITNNKIDIDDISYIVLRTYSNGWSNLTDVLNEDLQSYYLNNGKILILSNKIDDFENHLFNLKFRNLYLENIVNNNLEEIMVISTEFTDDYYTLEKSKDFHTTERIKKYYNILSSNKLVFINDLPIENFNTDEYAEENFQLILNNFKDGYIINDIITKNEVVNIPDYYKGLPIVECDLSGKYYPSQKKIILGKNIETYNGPRMGLREIEVNKDNPNLSSTGEYLTSKDGSKLLYTGINVTNKVEIPEGIKEITKQAFSSSSLIDEMILPSSVEIIDFSFLQCVKRFTVSSNNNYFTSINGSLLSKDEKILYKFGYQENNSQVLIDYPLETIESFAFQTNFNRFENNNKYIIDNLKFPKTLKQIKNKAFYYCLYIKNIEFTSEIECIGKFQFYYCDHLEKLILPNIANETILPTINCCNNLKEVFIPKNYYIDRAGKVNLTYFDGCDNLISINVNTENQALLSIDGNLYSKDKTIMYCYANGKPNKEFIIPSEVEQLDYNVFYYTKNLMKLYVPKTVMKLDCSSLFSSKIKEIYFEDESKKNTWKGSFASIKKKAIWNHKL